MPFITKKRIKKGSALPEAATEPLLETKSDVTKPCSRRPDPLEKEHHPFPACLGAH